MEKDRKRQTTSSLWCLGYTQLGYPTNALSFEQTRRLRDPGPLSGSGRGRFSIPLLNSAQPRLAQPGFESGWEDAEDPPLLLGLSAWHDLAGRAGLDDPQRSLPTPTIL